MQRDIEDFLKAGNDILNSVSSAIDRNDYSTLHDDVSRAVKSVSIEKKTNYSSSGRAANVVGQQVSAVKTRPAQGSPVQGRQSQPRIFPFFQKKISKYLGVPQITFASIAGFFDLLLFIGMLISGQVVGSIITGIILAGCVYFLMDGVNKNKLAGKYYKYGNILRDAEYFNITDLAKAAVLSDKEVLKDIKSMIKKGFLPRAKLDSAEKVCMITDRAYEQYQGAEQDRMDREARAAAEKQAQDDAAKALEEEYKNLPPKVVPILKEGREYITFVRQVNDEIPDTEDLSNKLYRLEATMNKIFEQVKKDPSSADELHKLMNYYLPTTRKLLNAYVELGNQPDVQNITQTKGEIDNAIDVINDAFESLLNGMFQDMAWDISSDISVMKTMMAQDGLNVGQQSPLG